MKQLWRNLLSNACPLPLLALRTSARRLGNVDVCLASPTSLCPEIPNPLRQLLDVMDMAAGRCIGIAARQSHQRCLQRRKGWSSDLHD